MALVKESPPPLVHNKYNTLFDDASHSGKGEFVEHVTKDGRIKKEAAWSYLLPRSETRGKTRSKTFPGIAREMAAQWGNINEQYEETII